ncbi:glycosyltransferase [Ichthyenterobacterium magnum]|uniref:Cellulose synthase/poly-beta-1,6-N-acetylglucosamine synthase-like glycosyltransferase n=1 Tax=Ichthyenterobacterium magnum TaxID=1230530 RepID=A0A420DVN0_9FLAO|nr:glycosyltransferase [Ichthyenterobacterium magnum]RKE98275.1 cellulose synthase/poly-beta-1,6-N-acetylglucosamine synthase-like glycosyltransferase [Ichthyenterobacterium magnum]
MNFSFHKESASTSKNIAISVLICAKNEAENLKQFLPSILEQEYQNFEVVLINDDSTDETLKVMEAFKEKHSSIKIVNVKTIEKFWGNKKYALTLGIKAATHNFLLFTDADCKPVSRHWISEMSSHFSNTKSIVIGYGAYKKIKGSFLNKLIRFETLLSATQYFSYAILGQPYMAVGRNLAYRKETFFVANGFMNHMEIKSGDDDLFINQVSNKLNTSISISKNSFTLSEPKTSFKAWIKQKQRHISTAKHYKFKHKIALGLFYTSQLLFWVLAILLLSTLFNWKIVLALITLRFSIQFISLGLISKKLNEKGLIILFPFLELFLITFQFYIFIKNLISKPQHWK